MEIKIVMINIFCILLILLGTGCIEEEYTQELEISHSTRYINNTENTHNTENTNNTENTPEPQHSPEMQQLIDFLKADKLNEESYHPDPHRGVDFYVCSGFVRDLAKSAKEYDIDIGAISIRDTMVVGIGTRYYHAMNYCIIDENFILIEPQTDEIYTLEDIKQSSDYDDFKYISIYQNAQMMSNYGRGRETIDIYLYGDYNESDIIKKFPPISY